MRKSIFAVLVVLLQPAHASELEDRRQVGSYGSTFPTDYKDGSDGLTGSFWILSEYFALRPASEPPQHNTPLARAAGENDIRK